VSANRDSTQRQPTAASVAQNANCSCNASHIRRFGCRSKVAAIFGIGTFVIHADISKTTPKQKWPLVRPGSDRRMSKRNSTRDESICGAASRASAGVRDAIAAARIRLGSFLWGGASRGTRERSPWLVPALPKGTHHHRRLSRRCRKLTHSGVRVRRSDSVRKTQIKNPLRYRLRRGTSRRARACFPTVPKKIIG
jgi:hypothetical protein